MARIGYEEEASNDGRENQNAGCMGLKEVTEETASQLFDISYSLHWVHCISQRPVFGSISRRVMANKRRAHELHF